MGLCSCFFWLRHLYIHVPAWVVLYLPLNMRVKVVQSIDTTCCASCCSTCCPGRDIGLCCSRLRSLGLKQVLGGQLAGFDALGSYQVQSGCVLQGLILL